MSIENMSIGIMSLITIISVAFGIYQTISNMKRNSNNDAKEEASQTAVILTELKSIQSGIDDIKKEITSIKDDVKENRDRTTRLEESCKQAHKRIDEIIRKLEGSHA